MPASFWHRVPFVRFLLPFAAGITAALIQPFSQSHLLILFFITCSFSLALPHVLKGFGQQWLSGLMLNASLIFFGAWLTCYQDQLHRPGHFSRLNTQFIAARLAEQPQLKKTSCKVLSEVVAAFNENIDVIHASGKLLLYLPLDSATSRLGYGDVLIIGNKPAQIPGPMNPDEFNYRQYMALQQVHHQQFIAPGRYTVIPARVANPVWAFAYRCQHYFKNILSSYVGSPRETAVAEALVFGYDDDIDSEIMHAYASTGTLHVLAVSGMHVGIIFMILEALLKFTDRKKALRYLKPLIVVSLIWLYSFVCGLTPSILRATVMITFVVAGRVLKRPVNIYNTLAVSAFTILLSDTRVITNVGFQLSYLAVAGIVFLHPRIHSRASFTNPVAAAAWQLVSVSIAAQAATFPLGLLYFHQFPNLFLVSNLLVIPLTTCILYSGILLMLFSPVPAVAAVIGFMVKWSIYITNQAVLFMERIPYGYTQSINFDTPQMITTYVFFGFIIAYFIVRRVPLLNMAFASTVIMLVLLAWQQYRVATQDFITFYSVRKHTALSVVHASESMVFADSLLLSDKNKFAYHISPHLTECGITSTKCSTVRGNQLLCIGRTQLLLLQSESGINAISSVAHIDCLVICGGGVNPLHMTVDRNKIGRLVVMSDVPSLRRKKFKSLAEKSAVPFHDVAENGSFQLTL
jgi:competence protein ComEC